MTRSVTIAEAADPNAPPDQRILTLPDFERDWESRLRVTLSVEDDEPLGELLTRAGRELDQLGPHGADAPDAYAPVYFGIDAKDGQWSRALSELPLVDASGHVRWNSEWKDEPYGELVRAVEAGAIRGDPSRLYFIRMGGMGDGIVSDFPMFIENLPLLWEVIDHLATVYATYKGAGWLRDRLRIARKAEDVAKQRAPHWEANRGLPFKLKALIWQPEGWNANELAKLLGITVPDAIALLTLFGCAEGEDQIWRARADEISKLMAGNAELLIEAHQTDRAAIREVLKQRIKNFIETGKAPDLDWEKLSRLPLDPHWSANHWQGQSHPTRSYRVSNTLRHWWWQIRLRVYRLRHRK